MPGRRQLPRFEVIQTGPGRYAAYDHLTKRVEFAPDPRSFAATEGIVSRMAAEAGRRKEDLSLERAENPTVKRPREPKPKEGVRP